MVHEQFPDTQIRIVRGGDCWKDHVMVLMERGKELFYHPNELYGRSEAYEETIEELILAWKNKLLGKD